MIRSTLAPVALAALASSSLAQGTWPNDPWTDLRVVSVTSTHQNGRTAILAGDTLYSFGTRNASLGGNPDGFLQIFDRRARGWVARPRMLNPGALVSHNFGLGADVRGDLIAVGAPDDRPSAVPGESVPVPGPNGYVRIMRITPDGLSWTPEALLVNPDSPPSELPFYGFAVQFLADNLLAVGAPREDVDGVNAMGAVHLYRLENGEWVHHQRITPSVDDIRVFGWRLEFASGDLIVASGRSTNVRPSVSILREGKDGLWEHVQRIEWPDGDSAPRLDAHADLLALPTPNVHTTHGITGAVDLYRRVEGVWTFETTLIPEQTDFDLAGANFGTNVAVDNDTVAVSTTGDSAVVQIFRRDATGWVFDAQSRPPEAPITFARSLDLDGDRLAIGDPGVDVFHDDSGGVYILTRDAECFRDLRGDANQDGDITFEDLNLVLSSFGVEGDDLPADLNRDGVVDFLDLNVVVALFGAPCLPPI